MSLHNLDAIHGDEHLGDELGEWEITEIEADFWRGVLRTPPAPDQLLAELLAEDSAAHRVLWQIATLDLARLDDRVKLMYAAQRLRTIASRLVRSQILEGNIEPNGGWDRRLD